MCDKCRNFRQFEKQILRNVIYVHIYMYPVNMFCGIKTSFVWSKIARICKHVLGYASMLSVNTHERLNFCTQYKISTALCDFIPKCGSWRIVDTVKDKKKKKNIIKIKTTNANSKQQQQKIKYYCQAGIRTTIACVESEDHSHWSILLYG